MANGLLLPPFTDRPNGKDWLERSPLRPWNGGDGDLFIGGGRLGRRRLLFAGMKVARVEASDATGGDVLLPSTMHPGAVKVGRNRPVGKLVVKIGRVVGVPSAVKRIILLASRFPKVV